MESLLLTACSGPGSNSPASGVANVAPVADAGSNKMVSSSQAVVLNGSGSDSDGSIVSWLAVESAFWHWCHAERRDVCQCFG